MTHAPDSWQTNDRENYNPNAFTGGDLTSYEGETPTGYDLTLRKVVDGGHPLVCGLDQHMNIVLGKAGGGAFGMARKMKFDGEHTQVSSSAVRREFDKVKGHQGDMKESFYNRSLLERQVLGMRQNPPVEQLMELHGIHDESEGTPDWSLNLPEAQFILNPLECEKSRTQSLGYFKPKTSILGEHTRISEIVGDPTNVKVLHQEDDYMNG